MQQGLRKGGFEAFRRQIEVEPETEKAMVKRVNGRFPLASRMNGESTLGDPERSPKVRVNGNRGAEHL
jgi:hypothetical protein